MKRQIAALLVSFTAGFFTGRAFGRPEMSVKLEKRADPVGNPNEDLTDNSPFSASRLAAHARENENPFPETNEIPGAVPAVPVASPPPAVAVPAPDNPSIQPLANTPNTPPPAAPIPQPAPVPAPAPAAPAAAPASNGNEAAYMDQEAYNEYLRNYYAYYYGTNSQGGDSNLVRRADNAESHPDPWAGYKMDPLMNTMVHTNEQASTNPDTHTNGADTHPPLEPAVHS